MVLALSWVGDAVGPTYCFSISLRLAAGGQSTWIINHAHSYADLSLDVEPHMEIEEGMDHQDDIVYGLSMENNLADSSYLLQAFYLTKQKAG